MKLFEHPDFEQAVIRAAEHFRPRGLREAIIEKDYYVTEALRIIEQAGGPQGDFQGRHQPVEGLEPDPAVLGRHRHLPRPDRIHPPLGKKAIDRELKKLRQAIEQHPGLKFVEKESQTIGGFGRNDRFEYVQRFAGAGEIRNRVFVEAGTASGREPTERVRLQSYVGQFLAGNRGQPGSRRRRAVRDAAAAFPADLRGEDVRHPRQGRGVQERRARRSAATPAITTTCSAWPSGRRSWRCSARRNTRAIKADYDRISREHFREELRAAAGHELCQERRPVPAGGTARRDRRRLRGAVPGAVLRAVPELGRGAGAP